MKRLSLFEAIGVELEYMIVDIDTLNVKPIADLLIKEISGSVQNEIVRGDISWSNELVSHVIELKCTKPTDNLSHIANAFQQNVADANAILGQFGAKLMPTAAHPWMNPEMETKLWEHDQNDIYELYNRVFNCKGHGWSNLQSTHINLPFANDEEFAKLHAAIRLLLPILPALAASSPILDSHATGYRCNRLYYYSRNQKNIPCLTGSVVPEQAFSKKEYDTLIYQPIRDAIKPFDHDNITEPEWLNSRGAIARFDRGAIEIRILDIQESPSADISIVSIVVDLLKMIVTEKYGTAKEQRNWSSDQLTRIYNEAVKYGELGIIDNADYLSIFGINKDFSTFKELWLKLISDTCTQNASYNKSEFLRVFNDTGSLATRILKSVNNVETPQNLKLVYNELCDTLSANEFYHG